MSFSMTISQLLNGNKTVTRRRAGTWKGLKPGDQVLAVNKVMGMAKGERAVVLGTCTITDVRDEPLTAITADECKREGFPELTPAEFVALFSKAQGCTDNGHVRRIEFTFAHSERLTPDDYRHFVGSYPSANKAVKATGARPYQADRKEQ